VLLVHISLDPAEDNDVPVRPYYPRIFYTWLQNVDAEYWKGAGYVDDDDDVR
jgi:hypothetical protein